MEIMLESMMLSERREYLNGYPCNKGNGFRQGRSYGHGRVLEFRIPRDRYGNFHPKILALLRDQENECERLAGSLYCRGMTQSQVAILTSIIRAIKNRIRKNKIEHSIMENLNRLDSFEKAILREFCLQNKNTISMPSNNSTVVGLEIKGIIYQASDLGFANSLGSFFPYSITGFAKDKLTNEIIDSPRDFTDIDSTRINDSRPNWVNISAF